MGNVSIAKSFKGILRISPIIDSDTPDEFLNAKLYRNFNTDSSRVDASAGGYFATAKGLDGQMDRYKGENEFVNGMLPVTDSVGNFLNFYVSTNGVLFGSFKDESENNEYNNGEHFPIIEAKKIIIGLEPIKTHDKKNRINEATLNILNGTVNGQLVIENNFCQDDIEYTKEDGSLPKFANYSDMPLRDDLRTIFREGDEPVNEYDGFVYNQENYNRDSKEKGKIDAEVYITNLQELVKERLEKYMQNSVIEMPTGSVIWQYMSLDKWYAMRDDGDVVNYSGVRPKMSATGSGSANDNSYPFYSTRIQGVSKEKNRLANSNANSYIDENGEKVSPDVKEIIPICKRDYALCDGSKYKIPFHLYNNTKDGVEEDNNYASYQRFSKLFSTIGYTYTTFDNIRDHYSYKLDERGNGAYRYVTKYDYEREVRPPEMFKVNDDEHDFEVLFGRDYCQMIAFYTIYEETLAGRFKHDKINFNRDEAEEWLKTTEFKPENYFASPVFDNSQQLEYHQKTLESGENSGTTNYVFKIGREIKGFMDQIALTSDYNGSPVSCAVWQLPEVQFILDMFDCAVGEGKTIERYYGEEGLERDNDTTSYRAMRNQWLSVYCDIYFQVPNLNFDKKEKYKMGGLIGSNGLYSFLMYDYSPQMYSNCYFSANELPHRHKLFIGRSQYGKNSGLYPWNMASVSGDTRASLHGCINDANWAPARWCSDTLNNYLIQFDRDVRERDASSITQGNQGFYAYEFFSKKMYNTIGGWRWEPDRCITSDTVNDYKLNYAKVELAKEADIYGKAEYFAPENIKMLPLIKL